MGVELLNHARSKVNFVQKLYELQENGLFTASSDVDLTLTSQDTGQPLLMEQLSYPMDWKFETQFFEDLLLPKEYKTVIEDLIRTSEADLAKKWTLLHDLYEDCVSLYREQRDAFGSKDQSIDINTPFVNEFAKKMIILDFLIVKLERYLEQHFPGKRLLRLRLLAGRKVGDVHELVKTMMSRKGGAADDKIKLEIGNEKFKHGQRKVTQSRLVDVLGQETFDELDRVIRIVKPTEAILKELVTQGIPVSVISANVQEVVHGILAHSSLSFLMKQKNLHPQASYAYGTAWKKNKDGLWTDELGRDFLNGSEKTEVAAKFATYHEAETGLYLGDSLHGDGPVMQWVLSNGGVVVVVMDDLEKAIQVFKPILHGASREHLKSSVPPAEERIFYASRDF